MARVHVITPDTASDLLQKLQVCGTSLDLGLMHSRRSFDVRTDLMTADCKVWRLCSKVLEGGKAARHNIRSADIAATQCLAPVRHMWHIHICPLACPTPALHPLQGGHSGQHRSAGAQRDGPGPGGPAAAAR